MVSQRGAQELSPPSPQRLGKNELRILVELQQFVLESRELEEIIFFMHGLCDSPASGARIAGLSPIDIKFVGNAILTRVRAFVDKSVVADRPEEFLHTLLVPLFRGADEIVVRNSHPLPQFAKLRGNLICILLRGLASGLRRPLDLLPMLVRARQKERLPAQHSLPPRNGVARNRRIGIPNISARVNVVKRTFAAKVPAHSDIFFDIGLCAKM